MSSRPAIILSTLVIRPGKQGIAPWLAQAVLCDDGRVRIRVTK